MMRDIKFRGMSLNGWVYGYYVVLPDGIGGLVDCVWQLGADDAVPVNSEIIGQYTGLTDKNGTEIYEGDIVECFVNGNSHVSFKGGLYGLIYDYTFIPFSDVHGEMRVIGNIYENPELIEDAR